MAERVERECLLCGQTFVGVRQRRYCSDRCRSDARVVRWLLADEARKQAETRTVLLRRSCRVVGQGAGNSATDVPVYVRQRASGRRVVICRGCGQTFLAIRSDARTCSPKCRVDVMRRRQRRQQRLLDHPDQMDERVRQAIEYEYGRPGAGPG
jgi:predicted nucleic acid-binding Zn ribbon protein